MSEGADAVIDVDAWPTTPPDEAESPAPRFQLLGGDGPGCVGDVCAVPGTVTPQR
ncbi:hypothetical protein [Actinotalea sp. Marseille-Q4924]|uniref:hypothetical protein n=1 Tax=Actinotalea sp. Marseille-Q4924 TaxID=2866571 RepID=UPI001CE3E74C|nr:hypothetical protein [Actinotalea sp. Marseille-Q4924]